MEHRPTFLFIIVLSIILTSCTKPKIISTETIYLATVIPTITYTHTPTKTPTITFTFTPEGDYSKIDIFNESTWPKKYQAFWGSGWLFSKEADRLEFQQFIEKSRATFFITEGITDIVNNLTRIRPELRSLWGMIYWANKNGTPVPVTPTDLERIMIDPAIGSSWQGLEVHAWEGNLLDSDASHIKGPFAMYKLYFDSIPGSFSSDEFGMPITGKDGLVVVPRAPYNAIAGDLGSLGYIGGGENRVNLLLMNVLGKDGFHHLTAPAASFDGKMVAPEGSPAITTKVVFLTRDHEIDQFHDIHGKEYTIEEVLQLVGKNIRIAFLTSAGPDSEGKLFEPKSKDDIATSLGAIYTSGKQDNWP
jgi:hypothetical protein